MSQTRRTARFAGLLYLLASIPGAFALVYVPGKLSVASGDAAAKADRIRASEGLLRTGIAAELVATALFIFVALVLYRLFQPTSPGPALAMMVLILMSVPISCLDVLTEVAALDFAGAGGAGKYLSAFDAAERDALAYLCMRQHFFGLMVAGIFWGLWLFPFGICVIRSGFIPRVLGILLMIAGCGYVARSFSELVLPQAADAVGRVAGILSVAELPIILWLLIWGAKPQTTAARTA
jgi:hypothetical protein